MRGLKEAIGQLPSWPGFVIGAIVIVGLGGWYYGTSYLKCTEVREAREDLRQAIDRIAAGGTGILDMSTEIAGDWDEVRIVQGYNPGQVPLNCPFGWDMTWRERQALVESGNYTIIGLFKSGQFQRYIEYNANWARFDDVPKSVARTDARFRISGDTAPLTLMLNR